MNNSTYTEIMNNSTYTEILDSIGSCIFFVDRDLRVRLWNKTAEEMTGFRFDDLLNQSCKGNLHCHIEKSSEPLCFGSCPLSATIHDGISREALVYIRHMTGERVPVRAQTKPIFDGDQIIGSVAILNKSEELQENKNEIVGSLTKMALTDKLTGLYNRSYFEGELNVKLNQLRSDDTQFGVLFLDVDNFGYFNKTYGHELGDRVLVEMGRSITGNIRSTDAFCRWGGEEFVGLFCASSSHELTNLILSNVGGKVVKLIRDVRIPHGGGELGVTASIGITAARKDDTVESIIARADALMGRSKKAGKNRYTLG